MSQRNAYQPIIIPVLDAPFPMDVVANAVDPERRHFRIRFREYEGDTRFIHKGVFMRCMRTLPEGESSAQGPVVIKKVRGDNLGPALRVCITHEGADPEETLLDADVVREISQRISQIETVLHTCVLEPAQTRSSRQRESDDVTNGETATETAGG